MITPGEFVSDSIFCYYTFFIKFKDISQIINDDSILKEIVRNIPTNQDAEKKA